MSKTKTVNGKIRHLSWKREPSDGRDWAFKASGTVPAAKSDLEAHCSRVEDQGSLGSCTGNGSTDLGEFLLIQQNGSTPQLSRLFNYYGSRVWISGWDPAEDSGAYVRDAVKCLAKYGAPLESLWPYDTSRFSIEPDAAAIADGEKRQLLSYYRCADLNAIKVSLTEGYPVVIGFDCPSEMFTAEVNLTGVIPFPKGTFNSEGGHCVIVVGHDDATRRVKFKNSWGKGWGKGGYGYLPYEFFETGHASDFWTGRLMEVEVQPEPTPDPIPDPEPIPDPIPPTPRKRCWFLRMLDYIWAALSGK